MSGRTIFINSINFHNGRIEGITIDGVSNFSTNCDQEQQRKQERLQREQERLQREQERLRREQERERLQRKREQLEHEETRDVMIERVTQEFEKDRLGKLDAIPDKPLSEMTYQEMMEIIRCSQNMCAMCTGTMSFGNITIPAVNGLGRYKNVVLYPKSCKKLTVDCVTFK